MGTILLWLFVIAAVIGCGWLVWHMYVKDEDFRAKHLYGFGRDGKTGHPSALLQIWWWLCRNTWGRLRNSAAIARGEHYGSGHVPPLSVPPAPPREQAANEADRLQRKWDRERASGAAPLPPPPGPDAVPPSNGHDPKRAGGAGMGGTQADLIHAIHSLVARGLAGDIHVKRRVIGTFAVINEAMGSGLHRFGARLSEPDQHYGNEIFEPLLSAGAQNRAASLQIGQSDGAIRSLMNTSVGELAASPRRAPHHADLNGGR